MENNKSEFTNKEMVECLSKEEKSKTIFSYIGKVVNGFSVVQIKEKGYNFLKSDGTFLWKGERWFDDVWDFKDGFAIVEIFGKGYNFLRPDGTLLWNGDTWFVWCGVFKDGFAKVYIDGKGYNYIKADMTFLWKEERWFDYSWDFHNGFAIVKIENKGWNYLKPDGTLLWNDERWFDTSFNFYDRFATVWVEGKGYNFLNSDGTLLWDGDKWFNICGTFENGFARVEYKGEWCYLTQSGDLISVKQYTQQIKQRLANGEDPEDIFNYVGEFENGFAIVRLDRIGWNFLKPDGTLLWPGDTWFDECDDFQNGFARVQYKREWCRLTQSGDLISTKQYFQQIEQRLANGEDPKKIFSYIGKVVNGFSVVQIKDKGYNFLKRDGTLLWNGDKWFDICYNFYNGFATVEIDGKGDNYLKTDGTWLFQ